MLCGAITELGYIGPLVSESEVRGRGMVSPLDTTGGGGGGVVFWATVVLLAAGLGFSGSLARATVRGRAEGAGATTAGVATGVAATGAAGVAAGCTAAAGAGWFIFILMLNSKPVINTRAARMPA